MKMKQFLPVLAIACFVALPAINSQADLVLEVFASPDSNIVNYIASGSIEVTTAIGATNSGVGRAPYHDGWSNGGFAMGDIFVVGQGGVNSITLDVSSTFAVKKNGTTVSNVGVFQYVTGTGGSIRPVYTSSGSNYPGLAVNDVLAWEGSGTFALPTYGSLPPSPTFAEFFNYDTLDVAEEYTLAINGGPPGTNGGTYRILVTAVTPVPEPTSFMVWGTALVV